MTKLKEKRYEGGFKTSRFDVAMAALVIPSAVALFDEVFHVMGFESWESLDRFLGTAVACMVVLWLTRTFRP